MYKTNEDKNYISKTEMEERLIALLGGRAAEKIALNDISTGASNDIEVATKIAKNMVTVYGMSDVVGTISINTEKDPYELQMLGEKYTDAIGAEVKILLDTAYAKAQKIILEHMDKLHAVAKTLLEKETITEEEFEKRYRVVKCNCGQYYCKGYRCLDLDGLLKENQELKKVIDKINHILNNRINYIKFVDIVNAIEDVVKEVE